MMRFHTLLSQIPSEWDSVSYVICGSASLAIHGVRDVDDLDLLVHTSLWPDIRQRLADRYWPVRELPVAPSDADVAYRGRTVLRTGFFDFFTELPHLAKSVGYIHALQDSTEYQGHRILSLRHNIAIKALSGRQKDIVDIASLVGLLQ